MPFFVYGANAQTGEVVKRLFTEAPTEEEARKHAEAHGMQVTSVIACAESQRPPDERLVEVRIRLAAQRARVASTLVQGAAERAAAAAAGAKRVPSSAEMEQLKSEMRAFDETLETYTPHVWVSYGLIGINALVFVAMAISGVSAFHPTVDDLLRWGAEFGPSTTHGQWWRLCTSMFVHIGIMHIAMNMLTFAYVGPKVERMFGNAGFLLIYLVAGLAGSLLALVANPMLVHAGASGAVFGIYGALFAVLLRKRDSIPPHVAASLKKFVSTFILYNLMYSFSPGISLSAHLGGLLTGFACGLIAAQSLDGGVVLAGRARRNVMVTAFGALIVGVGVIAVGTKYPGLNRVDATLKQFSEIETKSRKAFVAAKEQFDRNQMSNAEFADVIEHMLPEWRSMQANVGDLSKLPAPRLEVLPEYQQMRQQQLEGLADALHGNSIEAIKSAMERGEGKSDPLSYWSNFREK